MDTQHIHNTQLLQAFCFYVVLGFAMAVQYLNWYEVRIVWHTGPELVYILLTSSHPIKILLTNLCWHGEANCRTISWRKRMGMQMGTPTRSPTIIHKGISETKSSALNSKTCRSFLLFEKHRHHPRVLI